LAGPSKGEERQQARIDDFVFPFSKIVNSNIFCLFQWNFCKAPKILKIFVKPLCTM
jgi:hypothetical protein